MMLRMFGALSLFGIIVLSGGAAYLFLIYIPQAKQQMLTQCRPQLDRELAKAGLVGRPVELGSSWNLATNPNGRTLRHDFTVKDKDGIAVRGAFACVDSGHGLSLAMGLDKVRPIQSSNRI